MTTDFHGESRNPGEIRQTLEKIARAGFSHVHWCHEWSGPYLYSIHEMLQIREWLDELGLKVKGVHATHGGGTKDYVSPNEFNRLAGVELVKNRVELAHILDAGAIVLHFKQPVEAFEKDRDYRKRFYAQAFKSFDELEPFCRVRHIRICVENMLSEPPASTHAMFGDLFERYDSGFMGLCFDTGHANAACKENCVEYAERWNDRLFMIHIHDNQGRDDEHILPFEGTFNWEAFAPVLARSPYELPITMEPSFRMEEEDGPWLERAFRAGERFGAMVMKYR
ncbi:MAG: sugar phosphate isomerase/epimerase [Treponema sp.]|jgi:sugar phosphate isomerase/epimerase|nr:sugar phosphate isomerase/epimerase [Treponema sp.]